jgi:hypothetical protein
VALVSLEPHAGDTYTVHGMAWVWIPQERERGHWRALDHTGISIFPASDGIDDVMVTVPNGTQDRETAVHFGANDLDAAFHYGAKARLSRSH